MMISFMLFIHVIQKSFGISSTLYLKNEDVMNTVQKLESKSLKTNQAMDMMWFLNNILSKKSTVWNIILKFKKMKRPLRINQNEAGKSNV